MPPSQSTPRLEAHAILSTLSHLGKFDPPPYAHEKKAEGWRAGYRDAIDDIAKRFIVTDGRDA